MKIKVLCLVFLSLLAFMLVGCGKSDRFKTYEKEFEKCYSQLLSLKDEGRNAFESCHSFDPFKRKAKTMINGYKRCIVSLNNTVKEIPGDKEYLDKLQDKINQGNAIARDLEETIGLHIMMNACLFN